MNHRKRSTPTSRPNEAVVADLLEQITVDAHGDIEQLWAFRQAFENDVKLPVEAFVVGVPVTVTKFDFDGNERRGLTAKCRRADGSEYVLAAADVVFSLDTPGARYLAAYRKWMGLAPQPKTRGTVKAPRASNAPASNPTIELVVSSIKQRAAQCRVLDSDQMAILRLSRAADLVPGEIAVVHPAQQRKSAGALRLSGVIVSRRIDAAALGLVPLRLEQRGIWNPHEEYWGEKGQRIENWAKPIIARGPRPMYEMEQVLSAEDIDDPHSDPIIEANDRKNAGDRAGAYGILMRLCEADLRCLDAHAHLGNFVFNRPEYAIRHYEVGFRIGELSLGEKFDGLLQWGWIDNRPFLRCMHGFALCLWRLGQFKEAGEIFKRMLWLNPSDNQGVRFQIDDVRAKRAWEDRADR